MIKVIDQIDAGEFTILCLNDNVPLKQFKKVKVGTEVYDAEIVYDMPQSIGIKGSGQFIKQSVEFINV